MKGLSLIAKPPRIGALEIGLGASLVEYQVVRRNRVFSFNASTAGLEIALSSSNALNTPHQKEALYEKWVSLTVLEMAPLSVTMRTWSK
jgi:hypothetical protein